MNHRLLAVAALLAAAATVALAGCSSASSPAATSTPTVHAAASSEPSSPPPATPSPGTSASGVLTASITGLPASPSLGYGAPPLQFGVTLTNGTSSTYQDIGVVVSVGHCRCTSPVTGAEMAPLGTMQEQDPATGQWNSVPYIREGTGMDYLGGTLGSITLSPAVTQSYTLRIAFNPLTQQETNWTAGHTSIDVTVVALPSHTVIGLSPAATVPLAVTTG